jgi:hypothetical protein
MKDKIQEALENMTKQPTEEKKDDANKKVETEVKNKEVVEPKKVEEVKEAKTTESKKAIFERLKEKGIDVNSEDEVENYILNTTRKVAEVETRESELKKQLEEYGGYKEVIEQGFDPLKYFPSVEAYKAMQLKIQLKDLDTKDAMKVFSADTNTMSPEELISLDLKIKYPTLNDSEIKEMITEKYGEVDDRTNAKIAVMKMDAADGAKNILALRNTIKEPSKIDPKAAKLQQDTINAETLKKIEEDWTRASDTIVLDKVNVSKVVDGKEVVIYSHEVEDGFKAKVKNEIMDMVKANKIPLTQEAVKFVQNEMYELYRREHMAQILEKFAKDKVAEAKVEWDKENTGMGGHVSRQADGSIAPNQLTTEDVSKMKFGTSQGSSGIKTIKY